MHRGLITLTLFALCSSVFAEPIPDTLWTGVYDINGADVPRGLALTPDGGCVVVGRSTGFGPARTHFLRLDRDGIVVTADTVHAGGIANGAVDVYPLPDGSGFVIGGYLTNSGGSGNDGYLMKVSMAGVGEWVHTVGFPDITEIIMSMAPADDGGFLLGGYTYGETGYGFLARVNGDGSLQWQRLYTELGESAIGRIRPAGNDTYVLAAVRGWSTGSDFALVKINGAGDTLWTRVYDSGGNETAYDVLTMADGGFTLVGTAAYATGVDMYLVRTDAQGDTLWTRTLGTNAFDLVTGIVAGPAGGFVIIGSTPQDDGQEWDEYLHLIGLDAGGDEIWRHSYPATSNNWVDRLVNTPDGGYLVLGNKIMASGNDVFVVKTGPDLGLWAESPAAELPREYALGAYPNPFNAQARVSFSVPRAGTVDLDLFNMTGQKVRRLVSGFYEPGTHAITLNGKGLASGLFVVRMQAADATRTMKIVLMK